MPVKGIHVFLLHIGAQHGQFLRSEVLRLEVAVSVWLVGPCIALSEVGLVDGTVQFVCNVELGGQLEDCLIEAVLRHVVFLQVQVDGTAPSVSTEVCDTPDFAKLVAVAHIETCRWCLLVANLKLLAFHAHAFLRLWVHRQDDVESPSCGIVDFLYWYHNVSSQSKIPAKVNFWSIITKYAIHLRRIIFWSQILLSSK